MGLHDNLKLIAEAAVATAHQDPYPDVQQSGPISKYVKSGVSYHRSMGVFVISRPNGEVQAHSQAEAVSVLAQAWADELGQLQQNDKGTYSRAVADIEGPYVFLAQTVLRHR